MRESSDQPAPKRKLRWRDSLSFRLFLIAIASVLVIEALIFVPSATRYRNDWLKDQIEAGRLAALALEAAPSRMVSEELEKDLLESAMVLAVAELYDERRDMILNPGEEICCTRKIVLYDDSPDFSEIGDTLGTFFAPKDRFLIIRAAGSRPGRVIEIVADEKDLRQKLGTYGLNILGLSLLISIVTGGLLYLMLLLTVVRPIRRVTESVEQIRDEPGSWKRRLAPTSRGDEIGRAQNALSDMEEAVSNAFRQQERLAQLGEAVAKINHDLRNSLATAQLVSDNLSRSEDPRVAKSLPRLERALERAINLASDTLKYGRSSVPDSNIQTVRLFDLAEEAAAEAL
ncbi:MAG: histidine kinase dimerization/phospho-acceptor domain-containing protein, partial [Pseudomonadota bacterium]|nr:histidine kinase dimerization/phospho-acceptor domain-containing protein [Pseudomonadota bacterium]